MCSIGNNQVVRPIHRALPHLDHQVSHNRFSHLHLHWFVVVILKKRRRCATCSVAAAAASCTRSHDNVRSDKCVSRRVHYILISWYGSMCHSFLICFSVRSLQNCTEPVTHHRPVAGPWWWRWWWHTTSMLLLACKRAARRDQQDLWFLLQRSSYLLLLCRVRGAHLNDHLPAAARIANCAPKKSNLTRSHAGPIHEKTHPSIWATRYPQLVCVHLIDWKIYIFSVDENKCFVGQFSSKTWNVGGLFGVVAAAAAAVWWEAGWLSWFAVVE